MATAVHIAIDQKVNITLIGNTKHLNRMFSKGRAAPLLAAAAEGKDPDRTFIFLLLIKTP